jgi:hypothetical protein
MKHTILTTLSLVALSCASTSALCADALNEAVEGESSRISTTIGKIDHQRNILSIHGIDYCYSANTRIMFRNYETAYEYNLSPGTPVTLIRDHRSEQRSECVKSLSAIIIRGLP